MEHSIGSGNPRPAAFLLVSTDHGTMIVNRNDRCRTNDGGEFGVGSQLFRHSRYDHHKVALLKTLLMMRRRHFGDDAVAVDCGANIGVITIELAKAMSGWGRVIAFEPQEFIYYALAGNVVLNNCLNARVIRAALGDHNGTMKVPVLDYTAEASFGSLELRPAVREFIGQPVNYAEAALVDVQLTTLDGLELPRLDLLKIDIEGMEIEALGGATNTIDGLKPICYVELLKSNASVIDAFFVHRGYRGFRDGIDCLYVHRTDPCIEHLRVADQPSSTVV